MSNDSDPQYTISPLQVEGLITLEMPEPDFIYKIVVLGDSRVGKTSLIYQYVYDGISFDVGRTIGAILHVKNVEIDDRNHRLVIWDLGGEESFSILRGQYCANASGAFFVFDRTRPKTLDSIEGWLGALYSTAGNVPVIAVENKIDLDSKIKKKEITKATKSRVLRVIQTSATENENVDMAFEELVREIHRKWHD